MPSGALRMSVPMQVFRKRLLIPGLLDAEVSTDTIGISGDRIRSFIERIEHIDEEIKGLNEGKKEAFAEAKGEGFDVQLESARRDSGILL